jgi:hypothetical protein
MKKKFEKLERIEAQRQFREISTKLGIHLLKNGDDAEAKKMYLLKAELVAKLNPHNN